MRASSFLITSGAKCHSHMSGKICRTAMAPRSAKRSRAVLCGVNAHTGQQRFFRACVENAGTVHRVVWASGRRNIFANSARATPNGSVGGNAVPRTLSRPSRAKTTWKRGTDFARTFGPRMGVWPRGAMKSVRSCLSSKRGWKICVGRLSAANMEESHGRVLLGA